METGWRSLSPLGTIDMIVPKGVDGSNPGKPRPGGKEKDTRYFGVVISLIEVAQLTKVSRSTPEMYSLVMKMFFPSATAAE